MGTAVQSHGPRAGWWSGAALISLSPPRREDQASLEAGSGGAIPKGPSGGQTKSGASRSGSKGLVVGEHVPDRLGELSGDVDLRDFGAALLAEAALVSLVALGVGGMTQRVHRRLEHCPTQVLGPGLCPGAPQGGTPRPGPRRAPPGAT